MNRLAIFDLDGTITRHDTFLPYLRGWLRRHPERRRRLSAAAAIIRFIVGGRDRGRLKSDLIRAWMAGAPQADVNAWSDEFVAALGASDFCPGALAAIERHRVAGDRLVLLSASVDLYVPRIAARLGFEESICTGVAWIDGRLDGALATPNRRAAEKRRCVEALRLRFPGLAIAAYGNSRSDLAHLEAVEYPLLVNAGRRARRAASRRRIPIAEWRNNPGDRPVQSS
jgi:HAD superfamily hydrolase (TIGR01490 family)